MRVPSTSEPGGRWSLPVPTWRRVVAAAVGSLAVLLVPVRPPLGLWVVNGVLLVAAVGDWLLAVRPGELEVERELPGIVPLGAAARVVWHVAHRGGGGRKVGAGPASRQTPWTARASRFAGLPARHHHCGT